MSENLTAVVEGLVVIIAIVMGVRLGGIGLGLWGAAGTAVLIFAFKDTPGEPPVSAFFIIIAVITASAAMQAAGGIDWLVGVAGKIIQRNPSRITYVAPMVTFLFTMGAGTGNIYLSLIPVIYATSYEAKIRPERPLSVSTIASGLGLTASPVAAAMAAMLALVTLQDKNFTLSNILMITIPAGIAGVLLASFVMSHRGKNLEDDEVYQKRLAEGKIKAPEPLEETEIASTGKLSAIIFLVGVAFIVLAGLFPQLRPDVVPTDTKGVFDPLGMNETIQLSMFVVALIIVMWTHVKPGDVAKQPLIASGLVAAIALFGLAWMTATYLDNNPVVISSIGDIVTKYPLFLAVALFLVCALTTSQSATTNAIVPIGLAALAVPTVVGMWPSLVGCFLLPANGTQLAAVEIDQTGSTHLTNNPLVHSFTIPVLTGWAGAVVVGLLVSRFV
ncbi:MAG TPA: anaerobic C4-dicarboxylate transporter family protein [Actinomycetota bacterium]|jgi:anaerobic C4-dicarboxylate transporter DcuA/anaerobic C4-dicarboxylate transporter DcuB|nr:anaerobic C4-dicarboxylate transporter family protein [Actinomycetota bacterium]